jgi:serine protease Do
VSRPSIGPVGSRRLRDAQALSTLALARLALVLVMVSALLAGAGPAFAKAGPDGFSEMAAKLLPAVVNISTTQTVKTDRQRPEVPQFPPGSPFEEFFKDFLDKNLPRGQRPDAQPRRATSLGSGFIIDPSGLIATNNHVIADADEITVTLHDDTTLKAELVGKDTKTDLALLRVKSDKPLTAVQFGDSDQMKVGDASINRGNSGGPMFNMNGEVVGINTAIYSPSGGSIGIGFAIPSSLAKPVMLQLKEYGKTRRGWLGVRIQGVSDEIAESLGLDKARGALVASVSDKGPAQAAGIQPGDIVLKFDGKDVTDMKRLPRIVAETPIDKPVKVTVWRKRQEQTIDVTVGELDESEKVAAAPSGQPTPAPGGSGPTIKALGLTLSNVTPELKQKFSLSDDADGVIVVDVASDSPASEKGVRPGDIIVEVAQQEVKDAAQVTAKIDEAKKIGRKSILLLVDRAGDLRFVALRIDQS